VLSFGGDYVTEIDRLRAENAELRRLEIANSRRRCCRPNRSAPRTSGCARRWAPASVPRSVRSVVAEVLYDARDPFTRKLVLDKGLQHGVLPGQPVIDARGVIGQVTRVLRTRPR
jgi:rod shape-determining protein MreC